MLLPVVLTLVATQEEKSKLLDLFSDSIYTKWALEAFVVSNAKRSNSLTLNAVIFDSHVQLR